MTQLKLYRLVIAGLLLSNILLTVFLLTNKTEPPFGPNTARNMVIKELGFDEVQIQMYDGLIQQHRHAIRTKEQEIIAVKNKLYNLLNEPAGSTVKDSLIKQLGTLQQDIEHIHFAHFEDIKALCDGLQQQKFIQFTKKLSRLFSPPPPPHKRPGEE